MFKKIKKIVLGHKKISVAVAVILIVIAFYGYKTLTKASGEIRYILGTVEKGTIISSVSGTGQVSALNQIDIKSKVSGDVVYVGAKDGQAIKYGALLVQLDTKDAQKTVNDAEINLQKAQTVLERMNGLTTDEGTLRGDKEKTQDNLNKAYEDGFNDVANVFLDIPSIVSDLHGIIFDNEAIRYQENIDWYEGLIASLDSSIEAINKIKQYKNDVIAAEKLANNKYDDNFDYYKLVSRESDRAIIDKLISDTYDTVRSIADAVKTTNNYIDFVKKTLSDYNMSIPSMITTHQNLLNSYTGTTSGHLSSLLSDKNTIENDKEALLNVDFDIYDQKVQVQQLETTLADAKAKLNDYYITAPFDGVIVSITPKVGDSVSGTVATVATKKLIAEISFNEVDIAKIKVGQKATLTFDAVSNLTITGQVSEIDTTGTASQGVVSYNIKIVFDTQDERIKSGMSVSSAVITQIKTDALYVPNSSVKSQGGSYYVEITSGVNIPTRQNIEIGIANDQSTEILSGIKEGDIVVSSTINSTAATGATKTSTNSNIRLPGVSGGIGR